jgi:hypothetical protein
MTHSYDFSKFCLPPLDACGAVDNVRQLSNREPPGLDCFQQAMVVEGLIEWHHSLVRNSVNEGYGDFHQPDGLVWMPEKNS